jgi:hypothetical protein
MQIRGIYGIVDTKEPCVYIGRSVDCWRRRRQHDRALRRGGHHNFPLSGGCPGIDGDRWQFVILERVPPGVSLRQREREWIDRVNPQHSFNRMAQEDARKYPLY